MNPTQQMNAIHNVEAMIVKDEALRYRMYHTAYILLLTSLGLMMGVGGIYLYLFPELELVGITLVFASMLIGLAYMVTLKVRGIVGAASEVVLKTAQQRKAARNEIMIRGAVFAGLMTIWSWFSDDDVTPAKLAFTAVFNFIFWSLGMYAYYVIRSRSKSKDSSTE